MAIQLHWWENGTVLEYQCHGPVGGGELIARNLDAVADPRFPAIELQLCDMEAVTAFELSRDEVARIVDIDFHAAAVAPGMSRIGIACQEDLIFGFARMYEMLLDGRIPGWEVGVFRTRAEALDWLGISSRE